ncbi:RNA polymerase sigma factor [Pedobacter sp.]
MQTKPLHDVHELLAKIAKGDQYAFKIVYEQYRRVVYSSALALLRNEHQAEEVLQEVFLKLWLMGNDLNKIRHLESYLNTLARNRCLNMIRRIALELRTDKQIALEWAEEHNETEERIMLDDYHHILNQGIAQLSVKQKEVYQLCYQKGLKYSQAAEQLGISPLTVKTHMQLALRYLRNYVLKHSDLTIVFIFFNFL